MPTHNIKLIVEAARRPWRRPPHYSPILSHGGSDKSQVQMDKSPKSSIENQAVLGSTPSVTIGQPSRAIAEANSRNIDPTEPTPACATMLAPTGAANEFNSAARPAGLQT